MDSSKPVLNFLGRREFKSKPLLEQVSFVRQPLGRCQTGTVARRLNSGDLQQKLGGLIHRTTDLQLQLPNQHSSS